LLESPLAEVDPPVEKRQFCLREQVIEQVILLRAIHAGLSPVLFLSSAFLIGLFPRASTIANLIRQCLFGHKYKGLPDC
jgi:hypothetical protein